MENILKYETVTLNETNMSLEIIDQTKLPGTINILVLEDIKEVWHAINVLAVRGAPAIGIAAAFGIYIAATTIKKENYVDFLQDYIRLSDYLATARPTAVNLFWALDRMKEIVINNTNKSPEEIVGLLKKEAMAMREEDIWVCKSIGEYGLSLLKPKMGILTHCNAGQLATVKYGTATAPMYLGHAQGYDFRVFADETRPLLQGARLTAFELQSAGIDVTLLCDNMAATVMKNGWINAVFTGCDRVAINGDSANKIGTLGVAILAKNYGIPFYICAPTSTIDKNCFTGADIHIEERAPEEVSKMWYKESMVAEGVKIFNPAFDVTDQQLITAIITEYGIAWPPFEKSIREIFERKERAMVKHGSL